MCPRDFSMMWCGGRKRKRRKDRDPFMLQQQDHFVVFGIRSPHEVNEY